MSEPKKSLRIIRFAAENIKRLSAVEIRPDGNVITLTGNNGAGKSSILDAIAMALGGGDCIPGKPLRTGTVKGKVVVEFGDYIVTRKFTESGNPSLVIESKATGALQPSPQTLLDKLVGDLSFDPLAFSRAKPGEQKRILQELVGLDLSAKESEATKVYDDRTANNRLLVSAKAELNLCLWDTTAPAKETPMAELLAELKGIREHNDTVNDHRNALDDLKVEAKKFGDASVTADGLVKSLETQLKAAKTAAKEKNAVWEDAKCKVDAKTAEVDKLATQDPAPVEARMATLEASNALVRKNARHTELRSKVEGIEKKSEEMTERLAAIEKEKADELAKVKFPLPGLSFDKNGVLLNGEPFDQASDGEKIRASVAIGMALNPTLRIVFIRQGSLLDENGIRLIAEMAAEKDCQIWSEFVSSNDPTAIVIEDGHVKQPEPVAA